MNYRTCYCTYDSPIGILTMLSDGEYLRGLFFESQLKKDFCREMIFAENLPVFIDTVRWLSIYFSGKKPDFTPKIKTEGTEFQEEVFAVLRKIPYGTTTTYGEVAKEIAKNRGVEKISPQAVGGAVGSNPISIIIPCHRVVGATGNLTGYAGGIENKIRLLSIEKTDTSRFFMPKAKKL